MAVLQAPRADTLSTAVRRFIRQRRAVVGAVLVLAALPVAFRMDPANFRIFGDVRIWRFLSLGVVTVLEAAGFALALSFPMAVLLALGRLSGLWLVRAPCVAFIESIRAIPLLLLIFYMFLNMPPHVPSLFSRELTALMAALTLYTAAINAEIVRAGILSLDKGQTEAARSLGMSYSQSMRYIILPQTLRRMLPPLIAQSTTLLKDTSLGSVIGMVELLQRGKIIFQGYHNPMEALYVVALIYFVLNYALEQVSVLFQRRQGSGR